MTNDTRKENYNGTRLAVYIKKKITSYVFIFKINIETFRSYPRPGHFLSCILVSRPLILLGFYKIQKNGDASKMVIKDYANEKTKTF